MPISHVGRTVGPSPAVRSWFRKQQRCERLCRVPCHTKPNAYLREECGQRRIEPMIGVERPIRGDVGKAVRWNMRMCNDRILAIDELTRACARLRSEGKSLALCHGAFDLLHAGHIKHFQAAAAMADVLVVTLTEDRFIRKGPGRPVFAQNLRAEAVAAIRVVDFVATAPWPTGVEVIERLRPNLYVKGQDYREVAEAPTGPIVDERRAVERNGGRLVFTDEINFSSTQLLQALTETPTATPA